MIEILNTTITICVAALISLLIVDVYNEIKKQLKYECRHSTGKMKKEKIVNCIKNCSGRESNKTKKKPTYKLY